MTPTSIAQPFSSDSTLMTSYTSKHAHDLHITYLQACRMTSSPIANLTIKRKKEISNVWNTIQAEAPFTGRSFLTGCLCAYLNKTELDQTVTKIFSEGDLVGELLVIMKPHLCISKPLLPPHVAFKLPHQRSLSLSRSRE